MPTISGTVYDHTGAAAAGRIVRAYRRDTGVLLGQTTTGTGATTPGDPSYANVSLLLRGDGGNGSIAVIDSSSSPKSVTAVGNAQISTAQSKFGGASILFDGSGDYLSIPSTPALNFQGDVALTIEAWVYVSAHGGSDKTVFGNYGWVDSTNYIQASLIVASDGRLRALFGSQDVYSTQTVPTGQFAHIALSVSSTQIVFSVNGSTSTITRTEFSLPAYLGSHFIGAIQGFSAHALFFSGYIDELRITKGVARYTADFTPPTSPFLDYSEIPDPLGAYTIGTDYTGEAHVIALDDAAGTVYNDLIKRATPA